MPRGGRRNGTPGKSYGQRTDLQAIKTAPSAQYGQRAAQEAAQRALPVAGATSPGPAPMPAQPGPGAGPAGPMAPPAGPPMTLPGQVTPLGAPSERPNEPLTTGLDIGPGAGSEAMGAFADRDADSGASDLGMYMPALEFMASQPGASAQTRNLVRRLRANLPAI